MAERRKILLPIDNNEIGRGELSLSYESSSMTINNGSESIEFASRKRLEGYIDNAVLPYINNAVYNSDETELTFYHDDTVICSIDASDFIVDGMVSSVTIDTQTDELVIIFNEDAGSKEIRLSLTQIFDPSNYYDKDTIDARDSATTAALTDLNSRLGAVEDAYVTGATMSSAATEPSVTNNVLTIPTVAGPMGPQGADGEKGEDGEQGPEGKQGPKGEEGFQGPEGPKATTDEVIAAGTGVWLPLSGGTMTGDILVNSTNSINLGESAKTFDTLYIRNITANGSIALANKQIIHGVYSHSISAAQAPLTFALKIPSVTMALFKINIFSPYDNVPGSVINVSWGAVSHSSSSYIVSSATYSIEGPYKGPVRIARKDGDTTCLYLLIGDVTDTAQEYERGYIVIDEFCHGDVGRTIELQNFAYECQEITDPSGESVPDVFAKIQAINLVSNVPVASSTQLGAVKVGTGLAITSDGVLSATGGSGEQGPEGKQGPQGPVGYQGPQGPQGEKGANGSNGANGTNGKQGPMGPQGADGKGVSIKGSYDTYAELIADHPTGNDGDAYMVGSDLYVWDSTNNRWNNVGQIKGDKGDQGPEGKQGPQGPQGPQGANGSNGANGTNGKQGPEGKQGPQGPKGTDGTNGAAGTNGKQGPQGPQGPKGTDGTSGTNGKQGPQGPQGPKGTDGTSGTNGKQGPQGPQGPKGTDGTSGTNGKQGPQGPKATTAEVVAAGTGQWLPISGGTLTGGSMSNRNILGVNVISAVSATFSDKVYATNGFFETSDATLKTFLGDVKADEATVRAIPKKYFIWDNDELKVRNIGTSAQAIQALYPELVSEIDGVLTVDYAKLSIIALAAIDNLQTQIDELKEKIKKLENK